jgi:hypothetical protein
MLLLTFPKQQRLAVGPHKWWLKAVVEIPNQVETKECITIVPQGRLPVYGTGWRFVGSCTSAMG